MAKNNLCWFLQWVELVDSLVLVSPLQVQLDLLHQRDTVSLSDVQLLCSADAVFLADEMTTEMIRSLSPDRHRSFQNPKQLLIY